MGRVFITGLAVVLTATGCAGPQGERTPRSSASPTTAPVTTEPATQAICELQADRFGPDFIVAGAFAATMAEFRSMESMPRNPQRWADLADDHAVTVCYLDGPIAKSPPPGPSGEVRPSFNRAVVAVPDETSGELIIAGYQESLPVEQP